MKRKEQQVFTLRPFKGSDAVALVSGVNSDTNARDTTLELPWSLNDAQWWLSFIEDAAEQQPVPEAHFAIEIDGQLAGSIGFINIHQQKGELGYWLVDKYAGNGVMTRVVEEMVSYCFDTLGMVRIFAPVLTHNKASARVLEKNGFELEGRLKKYFKKDGAFVDALCYAKVK